MTDVGGYLLNWNCVLYMVASTGSRCQRRLWAFHSFEEGCVIVRRHLEGIKVLDISQVVAAPLCTRRPADFGADVVRLENPQGEDFWRNYLKDVGGVTAIPSDINYNCEVYKMVEAADVVTNLRQYEKEKFACSYMHLAAINPASIYGSITGVGKNGMECDYPAFGKTAYWGRAGVCRSLPTLEAQRF